MSATALTLTYGNHSPLCHLLTRGNNLEARSAQATSAKETTVASEHSGLRSHSEDATRAFPILAQTSPALISSHLQLAVNRAAADARGAADGAASGDHYGALPDAPVVAAARRMI